MSLSKRTGYLMATLPLLCSAFAANPVAADQALEQARQGR